MQTPNLEEMVLQKRANSHHTMVTSRQQEPRFRRLVQQRLMIAAMIAPPMMIAHITLSTPKQSRAISGRAQQPGTRKTHMPNLEEMVIHLLISVITVTNQIR